MFFSFPPPLEVFCTCSRELGVGFPQPFSQGCTFKWWEVLLQVRVTCHRSLQGELETGRLMLCIYGNLRSTSVIKALLILQRKKPCSSVGDRNWKARQLITFILFSCPHILWSLCIELNFHIYNRTGLSL